MAVFNIKVLLKVAPIVAINMMLTSQGLALMLDKKSVIQANLNNRQIDSKNEEVNVRVKDLIYAACGVYTKKSFEISKIDLEVANFAEGTMVRLFTNAALSEITRGYSGAVRNGFITLEDSAIKSQDDNMVGVTGTLTIKRALLTTNLDNGCDSLTEGAKPADKIPPGIVRPIDEIEKPGNAKPQEKPQERPQAKPQGQTLPKPQVRPQGTPSRPPTQILPQTQPSRPQVSRPPMVEQNNRPNMAETKNDISIDFYPGEMTAVYVNGRYHLAEVESFDPGCGVIIRDGRCYGPGYALKLVRTYQDFSAGQSVQIEIGGYKAVRRIIAIAIENPNVDAEKAFIFTGNSEYYNTYDVVPAGYINGGAPEAVTPQFVDGDVQLQETVYYIASNGRRSQTTVVGVSDGLYQLANGRSVPRNRIVKMVSELVSDDDVRFYIGKTVRQGIFGLGSKLRVVALTEDGWAMLSNREGETSWDEIDDLD
jgi:hypothetical protein